MENNIHKIIVNECQKQVVFVDFSQTSDDLEIVVSKDSSLSLRIINFGQSKSGKITAKIEENGELEAIMADFSNGKSILEVLINLVGKSARGTWKLSALSSGNDDKKFNVFFNHLSPSTFGLMDNYGVARNSSRLVFSGANDIIKGAKNSKTRQNAKIIVFDQGAIAKADPRLNISENEVEASHAAIVGKLNDDHLFYLMSRGLNLGEAKRLITLGYLLPIANYYEDKIKEQITTLIEERV